MAASRISYLFFLALVALAVETAHGADKREAKEKVKLKDYLEGQEADTKPPPQNASPLEVCILIGVVTYIYIGVAETQVFLPCRVPLTSVLV